MGTATARRSASSSAAAGRPSTSTTSRPPPSPRARSTTSAATSPSSDITWGYAVRKQITITYGQRLGLTARLRELSDSTALDGTLRVDAQSALARHWSKFDQVKAGDGFKVHPARSTSYRTMYAGSEKYENSNWRPLKVLVRSVVKAGLADNTVTKGKTFTARGRVLPGRTAKVALQRFINKKWTTVKTGRSGKDGAYRISFTAKSLGTSYWRVVAARRATAISGTTRTR